MNQFMLIFENKTNLFLYLALSKNVYLQKT